jgi:salicylate hydroxylase
MHRADLVNLLAAALPPDIVHTGHRGVGFEQDGAVARVRFANGASVEADVVIGADGIHSQLRAFVFPPSAPVFSGSVAYRGLVPHERVPEWPTDRWQMWLGKGKHFLAFPVRSGRLINFVGFVPADAEMKEAMKESWSAPGDPGELRREFAGWDPRTQALLSAVTFTFRSALYDRDPLPTWTKGRLSLLGDAAHPMLPHLGQGANQSIEDGIALATILGPCGRSEAPAALIAYERLRRERVAEVQRGARQNGMRYDSAYADLGVRDAEIAAHAAFRRTLYDHDVVPDARAAAAALTR